MQIVGDIMTCIFRVFVVHFFRFLKPCRLSKTEYERDPGLKEKINIYRKAK